MRFGGLYTDEGKYLATSPSDDSVYLAAQFYVSQPY